jgi:pilus assembly protein CpaF
MTGRVELEDRVHALVARDPAADPAAAARQHALAAAPLLAERELADVVASVVARIDGLGPLEPLLDDPAVTEVMVNGGRDVWVERNGRLSRVDVVLVGSTAEQLIERVVAPLGLRVDRTVPIVDARLPDGSRVHAVVPPLAVDGACLTIRRFGVRSVPLDAFAPPAVARLLRWAVSAGANVVVTGATSSGKTTLLNALGAEVAPGERIITIEDTAELRLPGDHVVRLEARPPTAEGVAGATIRDLVRAALRMRPDRLVVGEVRGPEALDMVQALSTGHDGSLATCHANTALDGLRRIEAMVLQGGGAMPLAAVRDQVHASIDLVVHVERGRHGARRIAEVVEVAEAAAEPGGDRVRRLATATTVVGSPRRGRRRPGAPTFGEADP